MYLATSYLELHAVERHHPGERLLDIAYSQQRIGHCSAL
jgi:hypothetical protein